MKALQVLVQVLILLCIGSSWANAESGSIQLDFESVPEGTFTEIREDGFVIRYIGYGDVPAIGIEGGSRVLKDSALNVYGAEVCIYPLNGQQFYFNSLDYCNGSGNGGAFRMDVKGIRPDGSEVVMALRPTSSEFSTLTGSQLGVQDTELIQLRVNLVSADADYSVDNIRLTCVDGDIQVSVDGTLLGFQDQKPLILGGSAFIPVRAVAEALGAEVSWDGNTETAKITKGPKTVEATVGDDSKLIGGRVLVPVRMVSEALGCVVQWDKDTRTIILDTRPDDDPERYPELAKVTLVSPEDNVILNGYPRETVLRWEPVRGALHYEINVEYGNLQDGGVQVFGDTYGFTRMGVDSNGVGGPQVSQTSGFTFLFPGDQPGRWRVRAVMERGAGPWSEWRYFLYANQMID